MRPPRAATCALLLALVASGCGALDPAGTSQQVVMVTETVATVAGSPVQGGVDAPDAPYVPTEMPAQSAPAPPAADSDLDTIVAVVPGAAGIAMAPVGGGEVRAAGSWQVGVAWSTIKVPLAIAAARLDPQAVEINASAITVSDNQAAENLWAGLGGGEPSAAAVTALLAEGGGTDSRVPSAHTRAGYSIFGQTRWSLTDQTRFATALPCMAGATRVVDLMGQISPDQRWGLGRIPGARFKGGWGPGESGGYLVRQFGLVPAAGGDVAVSLAVDAPTFESGTAALSTMADALAPQLDTIAGGSC